MNKFKDACRQSCEDWANSFDDAQKYEFSSAFESKMEKLQDEIETKKHRKPSKKTIAFMVNAAVILCFCTAVLLIPATREQVVGIFKDYISDSGISSGEDTTIWSAGTDDGSAIDSDNLYNNWNGDIEFEFGSSDIDSIISDSNQTGSADNGASPSENTDNQNDERLAGGGTMMGGEGNLSYEAVEVELRYIPDGFSLDNSLLSGGFEDEPQTVPKTKCYRNGDSWFVISKYIGNTGYDGENHKTFRIDGIDYDVIENDGFIKIYWNKNSVYYILKGNNVSRVELLKIAENAE